MTIQSIHANEEVRDFYREKLMERGIANKKEAWSLGVSEPLVSLYTKPESEKNLSIGLATRSLVRDDLAAYFAQKCGGLFVKLAGELDGNSANELKAILQAVADLQVETDATKRQQLLRTIQANAACAIKEESK